MRSPRISPDGKHVAVPTQKGQKHAIITYDVDAQAQTLISTDMPEGAEIDWVDWANDDRLLIGVSKPSTERWYGTTYDTSLSRVVAMNRDGGNFKVLFAKAKKFRDARDLSGVLHDLPDDPKAVLMAANDDDSRYNVYRVNVDDGRAELVQRGNVHTIRWLTDLQGVPRVRWDFRPRRDRIEMYARNGDGDDWDLIAQRGIRDFPELEFVGFTDDKNVAIVVTRNATDRFGLYEYDLAKRAIGKQIFAHPSVDVGDPTRIISGGPIYDAVTNKLSGVAFVDDIWRAHYFDKDLAAIQVRLEAMFSGAAIIRAVSWSQDRARFIIATSGPKDPASFFLYDPKQNHAKLIGRAKPGIAEGELGETLIVKYKARDGTPLPGYLTLPPGKGDKKLPLIVMPHGGPEARDYVRYDPWAQTLANRGYAVFQPNFRGSGGYGKAFAEKGYRQWGRLMQDDVTDGVKALIADGTADANRICIVGASYGGYAALAGGAFTPDLYKCVVAIAPVADLPAFLETRKEQLTEESAVYQYWIRLLGDPKTDAAQIVAVSPAQQAQNFKAPVLLVHGDDDTNVPIDQSQRMDKALRAAGKQVEFVAIEHEGHNFLKPASNLKLLTELERFIGAHIGN